MNEKVLKKIKVIFNNLCCSSCKNEFDENSITILKQEKGLITANLSCKFCGKDFGTTFIGLTNLDIKSEPATVQEGPVPINYDDVLDAHIFIKELDKTWQKHLPKTDDIN